MRFCEKLIAYNWNSNRVRIGKLLNKNEYDWTDGYDCTTGAAYQKVRRLEGRDAQIAVLSLFIDLVINEGVEPTAAITALNVIDEFRDGMKFLVAINLNTY